jgi:hypothetical protein
MEQEFLINGFKYQTTCTLIHKHCYAKRKQYL